MGTESGDVDDGPESKRAREELRQKRRIELIAFRMRAAGFGKLSVTLLAGILAGLTLWAMTTFTAELTTLKFDMTRKMIVDDGTLGAAWALYVFWAAAAVGITAFGGGYVSSHSARLFFFFIWLDFRLKT